MEKLIKASLATLSISFPLALSHWNQIQHIERQCDSIRKLVTEVTETPESTLESIKDELNASMEYRTGDWRFIIGDFDAENGRARCGGIAKQFMTKASSRGFDTEMRLKNNGVTLHYYGVAHGEDGSFALRGSPPCLRLEEL